MKLFLVSDVTEYVLKQLLPWHNCAWVVSSDVTTSYGETHPPLRILTLKFTNLNPEHPQRVIWASYMYAVIDLTEDDIVFLTLKGIRTLELPATISDQLPLAQKAKELEPYKDRVLKPLPPGSAPVVHNKHGFISASAIKVTLYGSYDDYTPHEANAELIYKIEELAKYTIID